MARGLFDDIHDPLVRDLVGTAARGEPVGALTASEPMALHVGVPLIIDAMVRCDR